MLETTPIVTMMAVMVRGGAICTILRTRASIRPDLSATPMPIMATRMIPTGPKFMKLATAEVKMKRMPSADKSPWTLVVTSSTWWVCGLIRRYVASTPSHCSTCESKTKIAIRRENSTAGCGTAFPTRSTVSRARFIRVLVAPLDPLMIRSLRSLDFASARAHPAREGVEAVFAAQEVPDQPGGGLRAARREDRIAQPPGRRRRQEAIVLEAREQVLGDHLGPQVRVVRR